MKGIIFNLFEEFLDDTQGAGIYEQVIASAHLDTPDPDLMVAPGTYPDADFEAILNAAADHCRTDGDDLLRAFGRYALPLLAQRYPLFFTPFDHPRDFLKQTGMVHHVEIKKLYKDAQTPAFACREDGDALVLRYDSERALCPPVEGLITGLGDYYQVPIQASHERCHRQGAAYCEFRLRFAHPEREK